MKKMTFKDFSIMAVLIGIFVIFIFGLGQALVPLTVSWIFAYASLPLVKKIEKKGATRLQATLLVLAGVSLFALIVLLLIIPPLISDLREAILEVPKNVSVALEKLDGILSEYDMHVPYDRESLISFASEYSTKISEGFVKSVGSYVTSWLHNAGSIIVALLNVLLIPVFFVYVLTDYERLIAKFELLVPPSWRMSLDSFLKECDRILSGFIRGQLLVCSILAVLYTVALLISGVKFAVIIGIMTGVFSFIPYVGFSFGFAAAFITALANAQGTGTLVAIVISYGIVQAIESFFITPKIVGDKVGLTPFEAILALIVLGNLLGFIGLFLAIPVGAITKLLMRYLMAEYKKTSFYKA